VSKLWETRGHGENALPRVQDEANSMVSPGSRANPRRLLRWFRAAGKTGLTTIHFPEKILSHAPFPDSVSGLLVHGTTSLL
jgi:hypothetical protein